MFVRINSTRNVMRTNKISNRAFYRILCIRLKKHYPTNNYTNTSRVHLGYTRVSYPPKPFRLPNVKTYPNLYQDTPPRYRQSDNAPAITFAHGNM